MSNDHSWMFSPICPRFASCHTRLFAPLPHELQIHLSHAHLFCPGGEQRSRRPRWLIGALWRGSAARVARGQRIEARVRTGCSRAYSRACRRDHRRDYRRWAYRRAFNTRGGSCTLTHFPHTPHPILPIYHPHVFLGGGVRKGGGVAYPPAHTRDARTPAQGQRGLAADA